WYVAADDEFLAVGALGLDPVARAPGTVGAAAELGDDALEAELAGVAQHHRALFLEMRAIAQPALLAPDHRLKQRLAIDQRCLSEVVAVEIEEIEGIEHEAVAAPL